MRDEPIPDKRRGIQKDSRKGKENEGEKGRPTVAYIDDEI